VNLKEKYYLRYCDDFVILSENKEHLIDLIFIVDTFLKNRLKLNLHPNKVTIRKYRQGLDFLGYVMLPHYRVLRTKTRRRIIKKTKDKYQAWKNNIISEESFNQSLQSYLGILRHCEGHKIENELRAVD